eukprot:COSAG06_NODE_8220_length_2233_cov_1.620431_1_plen_300_part_00
MYCMSPLTARCARFSSLDSNLFAFLLTDVDEFVGVTKWLAHRYPKVKETPLAPVECVQHAGDVVYLPAQWLHAIVNLQDSIGITVDHLQASETVPIERYHYRVQTVLDDTQLAKSLEAEQRECGLDSLPSCLDARFKSGLLLTYRYAKAQQRNGWVEKSWAADAERGAAMLTTLAQTKALDGVRARAAFVLGVTLCVNKSSREQGFNMLLHAIDSGTYQPEGFMELSWLIWALNFRAQRASAAVANTAETQLITFAEQLLADPESFEASNLEKLQPLVALLAEVYVRRSAWDRVILYCE